MPTIASSSLDVPRALAHVPQAASPDSKDVPARILKKRESDRRCQRIKRERTKSKIAALEEKVRSFGNQDPTGRVQALMQQLQDVERDRDELAQRFKTIENVVRESKVEVVSRKQKSNLAYEQSLPTHGSPSEAGISDNEELGSDTHQSRKDFTSEAIDTGLASEVQNPVLVHSVPTSHDTPLPEATPTNDTFQNPNVPGVTGHLPPSGAPCECCNNPSTLTDPSQYNTWRFTNQVLSSRFNWPVHFQMLQDTFRDDIPIRAIVEGWEAVEARGFMHPSWLILKKLDQALFRNWQPRERLAVMYASQLLIMSHTTLAALPKLPTFYHKRPSQSMADTYAIHFFPWPGMRERFVFNQHRYCTNNFWGTFLRSLRIRWPYEFRDCYTRNIETGLYAISHAFEERINDINGWAMEAEVFQKWPELAVDIPQYNTIPPTISNMVQNPRRLKAPPRMRPVATQQTELMATAQTPIPEAQATQEYFTPDPRVAPTNSYYSQPLVYNMGEKSMPIVNWMEYPLQQIPPAAEYFAPAMPINVTASQ